MAGTIPSGDPDRLRALRENSDLSIDKLADEQSIGPNNLVDFLLDLSRKWEVRVNNAGGNGEWISDAIVATKRVLTILPPEHSAFRERAIALSALLFHRSEYPLIAEPVDLNEAIHYEELAFQLTSTTSNDAVVRLQTLSALYEDRFERLQNDSDLHQAVHLLEQTEQLLPIKDEGNNRSSIATLRFKRDEAAIPCTHAVPFDTISLEPVSLSHASKRKFRFLDCRSLVKRQSLRIVELDDLPRMRYIAISYPWKGLDPINGDQPPSATMTIHGATDADPVSIEVLVMACASALRIRCELLWFDGLCIKQDDMEDKIWQIQNMYDVYKSCRHCLVIPGGLTRLADITEETIWIDRAWTLQEAVAPSSCKVLFAWEFGDAILQDLFPCTIQEVEPGKAGMADLEKLLSMSLRSPYIRLAAERVPFRGQDRIKIKLFGTRNPPRWALVGALYYKDRGEGLANAIWRAAIMRMASRPVDMIFSIMGLIGVTLDPSQFSVNDRTKATIALMKGSLSLGARAEWLGIAPRMPVNQEITTMPVFPEPDPSGNPVILHQGRYIDVTEIIAGITWRLVGAPMGSMSDDGYLKFRAKGASVRLVQGDTSAEDAVVLFDSIIKEKWQVLPKPEAGGACAVFIGTEQRYTHGLVPPSVNPWKYLLMILEEHGLGRFHNTGYAFVKEEVLNAEGWSERDVEVGSRPSVHT